MLLPGDGVARSTPKPLQQNANQGHPPSKVQQADFNRALDGARPQLNAKPVKHDDQPTREDLEKDQDGQLEYTVQPGDNWTAIRKRFGRSDPEMGAANPEPATHRGDLNPGDKLIILNDERAQIAVEMANTKDPEKLKQLVAEDLTYATRGTPTPGDRLKAAQDALKARRPGDAAFAKIVDEQGTKLTQAWEAQGRTHAVWDPLLERANKGDWQGVKDVVGVQLATLAVSTPTVEAINDYKAMLLGLGPQDPAFAQAVNDAVQKFLVDDPQAAADQVKAAYDNGGNTRALNASSKLRELTDPQKVDPLTAALIAQKAQGTIDDINFDFIDPMQGLWHDEPGKGIVGDYGAIYRNMSAVADSIDRSPEGKEIVESMALTLASHGAGMIDAKGAAKDGHGVVLSLAIAKRLLTDGDTKNANRIAKDVQSGVDELKQHAREGIDKLGEHASGILNPTMNWDAFFPADGQPIHSPDMKQWIDRHPDILKTLNEDMARVNVDGYHVQRALAGLQEYAPQLQGVENQGALVQQGEVPDADKDPSLSLVLGVSSAGLQDGLRQFNLDGMKNGELTELSKIVPDASWPVRMGRNNVQAWVKLATGARPNSIGLSLFGTGTYLWGVADHGMELHNKIAADGWEKGLFEDNGWRNLGFLAMYAGGTTIETGQALAQAVSKRMGLDGTEPGWKGAWGRAARAPDLKDPLLGGWGKLFLNHLRLFGWYNAIGTINYAAEGSWPKALALGTATAGSFLSGYPGLAKALKFGKFGGPWGTALTLIGSAAIYFLNRKEKADIAAKTEPFNKDYLIAAGVRPEIANELANNDGDGVSPAPRLMALAEYLHIEPAKLLDWINRQDVDFVHHLVNDALNPLKPGDDGRYVERNGRNAWDSTSMNYDGEVRVYPAPDPRAVSPTDPEVWNRASIFEAQSLEGVKIWAQAWGHPLPTG
ncbi:MAG TPA: LysM domain-containing protein [Hyphomicrobiales bacterium]